MDYRNKSKHNDDSLSLYQLVWGRQQDCNFWPGILLPAKEWNNKWPSLKRCRAKSPYIVFWLAENRASYVLLRHLYDFCEDFQQLYSPLTKLDLYISSVEEGIRVQMIIFLLPDLTKLFFELVQKCNKIESTDLLINWAETNIVNMKKTLIPKCEVAKLIDEQNLSFPDISVVDDDAIEEPPPKRLKTASKKKQEISLSAKESSSSTKSNTCPLCKKIFDERYMQDHLDRIHYGWRYRCCLCNLVLVRQCDMNSHLHSFHGLAKFNAAYEKIQVGRNKRKKKLHKSLQLDVINGKSTFYDTKYEDNQTVEIADCVMENISMKNVFDTFKCFISDDFTKESLFNEKKCDEFGAKLIDASIKNGEREMLQPKF